MLKRIPLGVTREAPLLHLIRIQPRRGGAGSRALTIRVRLVPAWHRKRGPPPSLNGEPPALTRGKVLLRARIVRKDQAIWRRWLLRRALRRIAKPTAPKPINIIAQVPGSVQRQRRS